MTAHSLTAASTLPREGRRWIAMALLVMAGVGVGYVGTRAALVEGFLFANDMPCGRPCVDIGHGDIAHVVGLLEDQGRYWAAADLYFPRVLLIDLGVGLLTALAVAIGRPARRGHVDESVRVGAWITFLLLLFTHVAFWEAIEFATLVTE